MKPETQGATAGALGESGRSQGSRPPGLAKPGAFRVLLWKEWRQQRWTLAGMTALGLGLFVLGGCLEKRWSFGLSGAALLLAVVGVPLVLSARAFAGEHEDGTAAFLRGLPFRPLQVFTAKFLVVLLASWAADSALLVSGWLWSGYPDNAIGGLAWLPLAASLNLRLIVGIALWLVAPVAAAQAALLASLGLRSLTTALLSGACLCLCVYLGAVSVDHLDALEVRWPVWVLLVVAVPGLQVLLAATLSAQPHPRKLLQFVCGAGGCTAGTLLFLLPAALSHVYMDAVVTPAAYVRSAWWRDRLGGIAVSVPAADRPTTLALCCGGRRLWGAPPALLDPATGHTTWLDAHLAPAPNGRAWEWSPDGSKLAWGSYADSAAAGTAQRQALLCVHDLRTQRTARLPGAVPIALFWGNERPWYDSTWFARFGAVPPDSSNFTFVNTEDGSTRAFALPSDGAAQVWTRRAGTVVLPGRGLFVALSLWREGPAGAARELVMAWCAADATAATLVRVNDPPRASAKFKAVSPDAKWAVFHDQLRLVFVDLESGATRRVALPAEVKEHTGDVTSFIQIVGFVGHGTRLLVSTRNLHAVYDSSGDSWQTHVAPPAGDSAEYGSMWTASPNGERFLQLCRSHGSSTPLARIFDLGRSQWTVLPLGGNPGYDDVQWYGNEQVLAVDGQGVWRYGLDGSRELLWPRE